MGNYIRLGPFLALLCAGSMLFYVQKVLIAHQQVYAAAHERPRGNLSDLYPRWLGARELLLHHRNPYSAEITREIQTGYYGRPLDANRPGDPNDQQAFAYPVYVVFLLAPTIGLPFPVVQSGMRWLLLIVTLASVPAWLRMLRWRPHLSVTASLMILTIGSFPVVQGFKLQQLSLLVGGMLAASGAALAAGYFSLAGFLLAAATIKPQLVLPVLAWLALWATSDWRRRWRFVASLGATMTVFFAASEYVLPGWIPQFSEAVTSYRQYTGGTGSLLDVLTTPLLGKIIAAAVVIATAAVGWRFRRVAHDSLAFCTIFALIVAATLAIIPTFAPYNQILLLPAIFLVASSWKSLWNRNRPTRLACIVSLPVFFWPWIAAFALTLSSPFLPAGSLERAWTIPLFTSVAIPLVTLGLLCLCATQRLRDTRAAY